MTELQVWNKLSTGDIEIDVVDIAHTIKLSPKGAINLITALSEALLKREPGNSKCKG